MLLIDLLERRIQLFVDECALVEDGSSYTYQEVDKLANRLSVILNDIASANDVVAIVMPPSALSVIAILGVMKARCTFLPIDATLPANRKNSMLEDSNIKVVITISALRFDVADHCDSIIFLDKEIIRYDDSIKKPIAKRYSGNSDDPCYVIYTSGSSGKPKGVLVSNTNILNYVLWANQYYFINKQGFSMPLFTSLSFDLTLTSIFTTLLRGDTIFIYAGDIQKVLYEIFSFNDKINAVKLTPAHISLVGTLGVTRTNINTIIVGGENLSSTHIKTLFDLNPHVNLYNEYGPTETTVGSTVAKIESEKDITIGSPIANTRVYVLNKENIRQPIGVPGELCISGRGVASGYLNNQELTSTKFVENTHIEKEGHKRLYKTGDLAAWTRDGRLKLHGRIDNQLKLHGFRIEPEEIEQKILQFNKVISACVLPYVRSEQSTILIAFIAIQPDIIGHLDDLEAMLYKFLEEDLPSYMLPSEIMVLDQLYLNENGKINRKKLIDDFESYDRRRREKYSNSLTITTTEQEIKKIWKEVLGVENPGVEEDFFKIGGHSLAAITIVFRVGESMGVSLEIETLFENPTIRGISKIIDDLKAIDNTNNIPLIEEQYHYPVSHAQRRLWITEQRGAGAAYNIFNGFQLKGNIDIEKLRNSLIILIQRHEALRTNYFQLQTGEIRQKISAIDKLKDFFFEIKLTDEKDHIEQLIVSESNFAYDLEKDALIRIFLVRENNSSYYFLLNVHHIIFDGWSYNIFIHELLELYNSEKQDHVLVSLPIQYKDYTIWSNFTISNHDIGQYWYDKFQQTNIKLTFPNLLSSPQKSTSREVDYSSITLSEKTTTAIHHNCRKMGVSLFSLLHAALAVLLRKYTRQQSFLIGSPVEGRNHHSLVNQVGFYTNMVGLKSLVSEEMYFDDLVEQSKLEIQESFKNQQYPLDLVIERISDRSKNIDKNVFQVILVLQPFQRFNTKDLPFEILPIRIEQQTSKFELIFRFKENENNIAATIEYDAVRYNSLFAKGLLNDLNQILIDISSNNDLTIKELISVSEPLEQEVLSNVRKPLPKRELHLTSEDYWKHIIQVENNDLFFNKTINQNTISESWEVTIKGELIAKLLKICGANYVPLQTVILGAYAYLIKILTNNSDILIQLDATTYQEQNVPFWINIPSSITVQNYLQFINNQLVELRNGDAPGTVQNKSDIYGFRYIEILGQEQINSTDEIKSLVCLSVENRFTSVLTRFYVPDNLHSPSERKTVLQTFKALLNCFCQGDQEDMSIQHLLRGDKTIFNQDCSFDLAHIGKDKNVVEQIEHYASKYRDRVALVYRDQGVTYHELNMRSNKLANYLKQTGKVGADCLVGLLMSRSDWSIISMLAILKTNSAYVPIDPLFPEDRVSFILEDSNVSLLLYDDIALEGIDYDGYWINIRSEWGEINTCSSENLGIDIQHSDLAYVIYTSGTTGKPKGVMVEHGNLVHLFADERFSDSDRFNFTWSVIHSICFDFSVWEIFGGLTAGGKIVLTDTETVRDPVELLHLIQSQKISLLSIVPSLFYRLMYEMEKLSAKQFTSLQMIVFGGEALRPTLLRNWFQKYKDVRLINMYGITETTVHVTYKELAERDLESESGNIGLPLHSHGLYIMDNELEIVPDSVVGELVVRGPCVTRGYLNRPEYTAKRFVPNPADSSERLYRSGDMGRRTVDADIEYIGRRDNQVKVRGYRIELSEIEAALRRHDEIVDAKVLTTTADLHTDLIAFVISQKNISTSKLVRFLEERLPVYMVPSHFYFVDSFPITFTGKIDHAKLLELREVPASGMSNVDTDLNVTELIVANFWKEILNVNAISHEDIFFEIGGHSLNAIQLSTRISNHFRKSIGLREIFTYPTLRTLCDFIDSSKEKLSHDIKPIEEQEYYGLSISQKGMWADQNISGVKSLYNTSNIFDLEGELEVAYLEKAIIQLLTCHEVLRTQIINVEGKTFQRIRPIDEIEFQLNSEGVNEEQVDGIISRFVSKEFKTDEWLIRFKLLIISPKRHVFAVVIHHLICDAWSQVIWTKQLRYSYNSFVKNECPVLPVPEVSYKDYVAWQQHYLKSEEFVINQTYWRSVFEGEITRIDLPLDFSRPLVKTSDGATLYTSIESASVEKLKMIASSRGTSLYVVIFAALKSFLSRYAGTSDVILGSTFAGRLATVLESQIGLYVNTIPVRTFLPSGETSFNEIIDLVKENILQAHQNSHYPFSLQVEEFNDHKDKGRSPIFDILIEYQNLDVQLRDVPEIDDDLEIRILPRKTKKSSSKYDLTFFFFERNNDLELAIEYNISLFLDRRMNSMMEGLLRYLNFLAIDPGSAVKNVPILSLNDEETLLRGFAAGKSTTNYNRYSFYSAFQEICKRNARQVALISEGEQTTYAELQSKTICLANFLRSKYKIQPGDRVAILGRRSDELICALLSVVHLGATFIPIDHELPQNRIEFILNESGAKLLLAESCYFDNGLLFSGESFYFDKDYSFIQNGEEIDVVQQSNIGVAYIIFTSGSTGIPKGVEIRWDSFNNYLHWANEYYFNNKSGYNFPFYTSPSFDLTLTSIFTTLLRGDRLYIYPSQDVAANLREIANEPGINSVKITPSHILLYEKLKIKADNIEKAIVGGEDLKPNHVEILQSFTRSIEIYNEYGPTETTVGCTVKKVYKTNSISIGRPINNSSIYILDEQNNLMPIGTYGEICVAGIGVSNGYVNNDDLTSKKFCSNPFNPSERLHHTGDVGRWLYNGEIEYKGRIDRQIKLNGYRIELGEIENTLKNFQGIQEVKVVLSDFQSEPFLSAYYTSVENITDNQLKVFATKNLPTYMVPSGYVKLDLFPLTKNGKIDQAKLPSFHQPVTSNNGSFFAGKPHDHQKQEVYEIWKKVLQHGVFGVDDNFFEVGGNSLLVVELTFLLQQIYSEISVMDIFEHTTISSLSQFMSSKNSNKEENITLGYVAFSDDYKVDHEGSLKSKNSFITFEAIIHAAIQSKLKECSLERNIDFDTILISLYIYQLSTIAMIEQISILYITEDSEMVPVEMNLSGISAVNKLFDQVQFNIQNIGKRIESFTYNSFIGRSPDKIHSVIYDAAIHDYKDLRLDEYFDLILGMDYSDDEEVTLKMTFNKGKLRDNKMKEFLQAYVNAIHNLS